MCAWKRYEKPTEATRLRHLMQIGPKENHFFTSNLVKIHNVTR